MEPAEQLTGSGNTHLQHGQFYSIYSTTNVLVKAHEHPVANVAVAVVCRSNRVPCDSFQFDSNGAIRLDRCIAPGLQASHSQAHSIQSTCVAFPPFRRCLLWVPMRIFPRCTRSRYRMISALLCQHCCYTDLIQLMFVYRHQDQGR